MSALLALALQSAAAAAPVPEPGAPPVCGALLATPPDLAALERIVGGWAHGGHRDDWHTVCAQRTLAPARGPRPDTPLIIPLLVILAPPVGIPAAVDQARRPTPGHTPARREALTVGGLVAAHADPAVPLLFARHGMDHGVVADRFVHHIEAGEHDQARALAPLVPVSMVARRELHSHTRTEDPAFADHQGPRRPLPPGAAAPEPWLWPALGAAGFDLCPLVPAALAADQGALLRNGLGACDTRAGVAAWFGQGAAPLPDTRGAFDPHHRPTPAWPPAVAAMLGVATVAPDGPAARYWAVRVGEEPLEMLRWGHWPPGADPTELPPGWRAAPAAFQWGPYRRSEIPTVALAALDDALARCDVDGVAAARAAPDHPAQAPSPLAWLAAAELCPGLALALAETAMPPLNTAQALRWDLGPAVSARIGEALAAAGTLDRRAAAAALPPGWSRASRRALRRAMAGAPVPADGRPPVD